MAKRLFVAGLPWATTDQDLLDLFSKYGNVNSAKFIMDRYSGRSKGFGVVEFENDDEADKAISELNGSKLGDRDIIVNVARPMGERSNDRPRYSDRGGSGYDNRRSNSGGGSYRRGDR